MLLLGGLSHSSAGEDAPPPPTPVPVKPQAEFSITVSDNPSTGYSVGLAHVSEGVFLLRTEPQKLPPNAPPGAAGGRTFHFFHWHHERPEQAPEIVFARFQPFDLENSYREEKYVLDIRRKAPARPSRVPSKP